MQNLLKKIINRSLAPMNLKVSRVHKNVLSGINLFDDLQLLIKTDSPICLDVGANVGQTIKHLLNTFRNPYIYSFEPSKNTFQILKSKEYSDRIFLCNYALGREITKREFINYNNSYLSSFLPLDSSDENRFRDVTENNRELVKVETVDNFLSKLNIENVDLLKIDTQGFDLEVLSGAEKALQNGVVQNVLIELNFVKMYVGQSSSEDIINFLGKHGLFLIDYYEKYRQNERKGGTTLAWCTALFGRR